MHLGEKRSGRLAALSRRFIILQMSMHVIAFPVSILVFRFAVRKEGLS